MAPSKQVLISFLLLLISFSYAQRGKKFFRCDYKYIEQTRSFYKIHTIFQKWMDAYQVCAAEGATLFYPDDQTEADALRDFWNKTQQFNWVYVGVSALMEKGVFETVDGTPIIAHVFNKWGPGEPNDVNGVEDCVILRREGTLNDVNCDNKYPFVCKKTLSSLEWNSFCNMPNLDYKFGSPGKCYKFSLTPKSWSEAYTACVAEQSYLAIINSQEEADILTKITDEADKDLVEGDYLRGAVHLGFYKNTTGWVTILGQKLQDSGYSKWGYGQPDNAGGNEVCGSMSYSAILNDINCSMKMFYICEHDAK